MIKNVIFDLGRVIYTYWPYEYLKSMGYDEPTIESLMKLIFESPLWSELDRGTLTVAEGAELYCKQNPALAGEIRRILRSDWVDEVVRVLPDSLDFYREVKRRGFGLYILSNFGEDSFARVYDRDAFLQEADGMVISAHAKYIKPEREIYELLLQKYKLTASECLFIDDNADNIAAAEQMGIHGIVFTDINDCRARFERLLVDQSK